MASYKETYAYARGMEVKNTLLQDRKEDKPTTLSFSCALDNVRTESATPLLGPAPTHNVLGFSALAPYQLHKKESVASPSDYSWKVELKGGNQEAAYRVYTNNADPTDFQEYADKTIRVIDNLTDLVTRLSLKNDKLSLRNDILEAEIATLRSQQ